ncbi:Nif3-like dinuclear metal center hexameric protein [Candidatus Woesearchaeota archaeon]|nr:Nif3-like dinuclear metal center hexameric protein [Candidatus Woesearchaeota archaeon]
MISTLALTRYLHRILSIKDIPDASLNGLQVRGTTHVTKIGAAVDCNERTIMAAEKAGVDFLIVHHGLFWKGQRDATCLRRRTVGLLKKAGINLYAAHLPLDLHREYGNNIGLYELLGLRGLTPFGEYHGVLIGYRGEFVRPKSPSEIKKVLDKGLKTTCSVHAYGPKKIKSIGIVSGGAFLNIADALKQGLDCYLTGEGPHYAGDVAKEAGITLIMGGHYETEMFGVQRLSKAASQHYGVPYTFLYVPPL